MRVEDVMTKEVIAVAPSMPLKDVAALMVRHRISGMPIVEDSRVVGVISESDIVEKEEGPGISAAHAGKLEASTAGEAMTSPAVTAEPWMTLSFAAWQMIEHDVNRLPVLHGTELVGIVTRADLVRGFGRSDGDIQQEIREHVLPSFGLGPNEVSVTVDKGEVTLTGTLQDEGNVESLPKAVKFVTGVVRVHSELESPVGSAPR